MSDNYGYAWALVTEIRGIVNGTCGVVLDARAQGFTLADAVGLAMAQGFAEADPTQDLSVATRPTSFP
jgi:homoserine dehydrogenase